MEVRVPLPSSTIKLPDPDPVILLPIEWSTITSETTPDGDWVFIAITPEQYERLSLNMAELLRWIKEAKNQLTYYKEN